MTIHGWRTLMLALLLSLCTHGTAQIALLPAAPVNTLHAEPIKTHDFTDADRIAIREALRALPFRLPDALSARTRMGDLTPTIIAALEALRAKDVPRNLALARALLERAAAQSDPRALFGLAVLNAEGMGVARDTKAATAILSRLRAVDFPRAYCAQAELDSRLPGGSSLASVRAGLIAGAVRGDSMCQNLLAIHFERDGEINNALSMYRQAAAQANNAAIRNLQRLDAKAFDPREQPTKILQKRAVEGDPLSQYELARRYHMGIGVPADLRAAFGWYVRAAPAHGPSRGIVAAVMARSPNDDSNEINLEALAELSAHPLVVGLQQPPLRSSPIRDADLLVGLELLPVDPYTARLRGESSAGASRPAAASSAQQDRPAESGTVGAASVTPSTLGARVGGVVQIADPNAGSISVPITITPARTEAPAPKIQ